MEFSWKDLAPELSFPLLQGSVGVLHLTSLSDCALRLSQRPGGGAPLLALGADMLHAAWERDVLCPSTARQAMQLQGVFPFLSEALRAWAGQVTALYDAAGEGRWLDVLQEGHADATRAWLDARRAEEPHNLFWLQQGLSWGLSWGLSSGPGTESPHSPGALDSLGAPGVSGAPGIAGMLDWLHQWTASAEGLPTPLRWGLLADVDFARGDYATARARYFGALRHMPLPLWRERMGEAALRLGAEDEALAAWDAVLAQRPWHTNLLLRRDEVRRGRHAQAGGVLPEGQGAVLLYTWNKAACLDKALQTLADSELGRARVVVLDNGSTDVTPQVLAGWASRLGDRLHCVTLPCNIGAPAARNWLLTLPQTQDCQWVAFVDDDALLPPQWLLLLGRAMRDYPDHAAYGCRVAQHGAPLTLQSVDLHLERAETTPWGEDQTGSAHGPCAPRFAVSTLHQQVADFGDFSYTRPCLSVTGCCHVLRREYLDRVRPFNIAFSPSQYDDLERDLRGALAGQWAVYQGHVRVEHMQMTGKSASSNSVGLLHAWANMFKLQTLYTQEQYDSLRSGEHALLLADMLRRTQG